jgi:hypothetical protein
LDGSVAAVERALRDPKRVIAASDDLAPDTADAFINDGVVNSARQLIDPGESSELAAVVIADHFDVVGHYDRTIWVTDPDSGDERPQDLISGLVHSGSQFRDNEFFRLFEGISACIAPQLGG